MPIDFDAYFSALAGTSVDDKTEHTDRGFLQRVLDAAAATADARLRVQHEPKRDKGGGGSPDYMVKRDARIVGYVEVKTIDEALAKIIRSDQIKKYRKLSDNLLITDYLEFVWLKGDEVQRARLAHSDDLTGRRLALKPESVEQVTNLLRGFFSSAPQNIGRGQTLAVELATRAAMLRDFLTVELIRQEKQNDKGRLYALYDAFRVQVFHDLTDRDFADAFAQMLAYSLFLARLNAGDNQTIDLDNVRRFIPGSFSLIRELVRFLEEMHEEEYKDARWIIDEILSIVNGIDLAAIQSDLSFRARKAISRKVRAGDEEEHRLFERDPFIYFYEDFLKAYDPAMRKSRGVYYTPPPVVNFIVRAVDDILKETFGIRDGLADHRKVTVLDFACGTGTFLLEVFERAFETIGGAQAGRADAMVREHLTKNIYGFEYLIAPYTIAHLKLSQYLRDKGHPLQDQERLQVFLTNTLEPVEPQRNLLLPELSHEVEAAQAVKEKPILVITGNPPYSAISKNRGLWINSAIEKYKQIDGKHFGEKKHWLHDDYVKFMRFAQIKMDLVDEGIVGIITNHSWIDNPTFRGMRQSILKSFDQVYILDLHGNYKKNERSEDGLRDENVFDIEQGVSISIFVKKRGIDKGIWRGDLRGKRLEKYRFLTDSNLKDAASNPVTPDSPYYFFEQSDLKIRDKYNEYIPINEIFPTNVTGVVTARDGLVIDHSSFELKRKFDLFANPDVSDSEIRKRYAVGDNYQWKLPAVRSSMSGEVFDADKVIPFAYHPFDTRALYNDPRLVFRPRTSVMKTLVNGNIGLVSTRMTKDQGSVFCVESAIGHKCASVYDLSYVFPIYTNEPRVENISAIVREYTDKFYGHHFGPEEIFGYTYAVLHAPTYRQRYAAFLRIDFPRIPFAETKAQFEALSTLGWALVQAHLLKAVPRSATRLGDYVGKGDHTVEAVRYSPQEATIWINKTQGFANVPQAVWDFHIGGYQVLDKYLKSRKGRTLSLDEQTHLGEVAEALSFTIDQMARIDVAYLAAFPEVDNSKAALAPQA